MTAIIGDANPTRFAVHRYFELLRARTRHLDPLPHGHAPSDLPCGDPRRRPGHRRRRRRVGRGSATPPWPRNERPSRRFAAPAVVPPAGGDGESPKAFTTPCSRGRPRPYAGARSSPGAGVKAVRPVRCRLIARNAHNTRNGPSRFRQTRVSGRDAHLPPRLHPADSRAIAAKESEIPTSAARPVKRILTDWAVSPTNRPRLPEGVCFRRRRAKRTPQG